MDTAVAVGSLGLNDKYELDVSSATIRNEMAALADQGFLRKTHSSSGRIPTTLAWRYFIEEIMEQLEDLEVLDETKARERIFQNRFNTEALLKESVMALAEFTGYAAIAMVGNNIYYAGVSNLVEEPELQDINRLKALLTILENHPTLSEIFNKMRGDSPYRVLIEDEIGLKSLDRFSIVYTDIKMHAGKNGHIAVLGPSRMNYAKTFTSLERVTKHLKESVIGW